MIELSGREARRLAVASQGLGARRFPRGLGGARQAIRHLGYVQIDTISVVERAHHHVLASRVDGYRPEHLDKLVAERSILEYWAHAAAYLPMEDYRFCLPRMRWIAERRRHWHEHDEALAAEILARIRAEGPLRPADFESHTGTTGMWQWGPVKRAIEFLFMSGELLVTRREAFQKIYDLAERVIPAGTDATPPTRAEYARHLVNRFMTAHGIARSVDFGHLRRGMRGEIDRVVREEVEAGRLLEATIRGSAHRYYVTPDFEQALKTRAPRSAARLLSPFDNLLIQRDRTLRLFGFDYQLECYVPADKRRYGYFCLPILRGTTLVGRVDAKAERKAGRLLVRGVFVERETKDTDGLYHALANALQRLGAFTGCKYIDVAEREDQGAARRLQRALRNRGAT